MTKRCAHDPDCERDLTHSWWLRYQWAGEPEMWGLFEWCDTHWPKVAPAVERAHSEYAAYPVEG